MPLTSDDLWLAHMARTLDAVAAEAGDLAMRWFRPGKKTSARTDYKPGGSPVTEADLAVDAFLTERLRPLVPQAAWLSEETLDSPERLSRETVLVVDPIDGTRGFAAGDARWCVSVALVRAGRPIAGAIAAPAAGERYFAFAGGGAWLNGARLDIAPRENLAGGKIAGPQPSTTKVAHALDMEVAPRVPSLAMRFAMVAGGALEGALSSPNSHDWDIAAADLILHEAGGLLTALDGTQIRYNRTQLTHGALAAAARASHPAILAAFAHATTS
ncbi:MAG: 3'(2'),5'-bisphosphate nucleotidase CysQ [Rhodoblastus sp.]